MIGSGQVSLPYLKRSMNVRVRVPYVLAFPSDLSSAGRQRENPLHHIHGKIQLRREVHSEYKSRVKGNSDLDWKGYRRIREKRFLTDAEVR